jgi:hypothetical protein
VEYCVTEIGGVEYLREMDITTSNSIGKPKLEQEQFVEVAFDLVVIAMVSTKQWVQKPDYTGTFYSYSCTKIPLVKVLTFMFPNPVVNF